MDNLNSNNNNIFGNSNQINYNSPNPLGISMYADMMIIHQIILIFLKIIILIILKCMMPELTLNITKIMIII